MSRLNLILVALTTPPTCRALVEEYYTTNAVCHQNHCINPVFPGFHKLTTLQHSRWRKYSLAETSEHMSFCKDFLTYDPALPVVDYSHKWNTSAHTMQDMVREQESEAARLYFFHLSAMGLEAWDYPHPEKDGLPMSSCVRQVAKMACYTYLPMGNPTLKVGMETRYFKPCKNACENYVKECNVDCCDDSVKCVFDESFDAEQKAQGITNPPASNLQVKTGYANYDGPCEMCTGAAYPLNLGVWAVAVAIVHLVRFTL